ncbi:MAG: toxin-antitoxin system HicB family antitoxin [Pirellulales bacterium]
MSSKEQQIHRVATGLFHQNVDWVTFYREIFGVGGLVRRTFTDAAALATFEQTSQYSEIQQMLARLRAKSAPLPEPTEPTRVITIRLPKSLHDSLKCEASNHRTSMNKLCISKLLQMVDGELIPVAATANPTE